MRASPQPYWRDSVSADLYYKPDIVKANSYTVCWHGRGLALRLHLGGQSLLVIWKTLHRAPGRAPGADPVPERYAPRLRAMGGTSDTFSGFFIRKISGMIASVTMAMNQKISLKASICA